MKEASFQPGERIIQEGDDGARASSAASAQVPRVCTELGANFRQRDRMRRKTSIQLDPAQVGQDNYTIMFSCVLANPGRASLPLAALPAGLFVLDRSRQSRVQETY